MMDRINKIGLKKYAYSTYDHLGNNRVDLELTAGAEFKQIAHYYPFGLTMEGGLRTGSQRWLYGGKELDRISGLDLYDFEARAYDPATIRFTRPDDLAEQYLQTTPFAYCLNNPLRLIDPTRREVYMLFYTTNNNHYGNPEKNADAMFREAALPPTYMVGSDKGVESIAVRFMNRSAFKMRISRNGRTIGYGYQK